MSSVGESISSFRYLIALTVTIERETYIIQPSETCVLASFAFMLIPFCLAVYYYDFTVNTDDLANEPIVLTSALAHDIAIATAYLRLLSKFAVSFCFSQVHCHL